MSLTFFQNILLCFSCSCSFFLATFNIVTTVSMPRFTMQSFNNCSTSPNRQISGNWQISFSFKPDYISCPEEHKVSENTGVARGTDTSSNEGEKVGQAQPGKPVLAKQNHNPHSFWKSSKTVLIWEQFLLFDDVSFFTLSSTLNGEWGGRVSGAQERTRG